MENEGKVTWYNVKSLRIWEKKWDGICKNVRNVHFTVIFKFAISSNPVAVQKAVFE